MKDIFEFANDLVKQVKNSCALTGIEFRAEDKPFVTVGIIECSGYFDDQKKILSFATGKRMHDWVTTLAHEYCHLVQWATDCPYWLEGRTNNSDAVLDSWLAGTDYPEEQLDAAFKASMMIELDCERRTVELLRNLQAPVDLDEYTQKANAYVMSYVNVRKTRKWYDPMNPPYSDEALCATMPKDFTTLDYENAIK